MIVVIGGIKGGTGKTTIATNLTYLRSSIGKKVLLVDADEQKSALSWSAQRHQQEIPCSWSTFSFAGNAVRDEVLKIKNNYDDIIIDVGGRDTTSQRAALTIADVYIMPFQPRSFDVWTLPALDKLLKEIEIINPSMKSYALISMCDSRGNDNEEAKSLLMDKGLICSPCMIGHRKSFCHAASMGISVVEMKIRDMKAINEISNLHKFIYQNGNE